uniref:Uncharacterized protein n=1 Tax=Thermosporothrix sp. COM3 TaxID=2490863 RepID=A0A455SFZ5_9CHLR|nr:hypothetical protein KTC_09920 [Thermosporothrix sp. COM3]
MENETGTPPQGNAPYGPPERPCFICGQQAWHWNGEGYVCASGDAKHQEREQWSWVHVPEKPADEA